MDRFTIFRSISCLSLNIVAANLIPSLLCELIHFLVSFHRHWFRLHFYTRTHKKRNYFNAICEEEANRWMLEAGSLFIPFTIRSYWIFIFHRYKFSLELKFKSAIYLFYISIEICVFLICDNGMRLHLRFGFFYLSITFKMPMTWDVRWKMNGKMLGHRKTDIWLKW